VCDDDDGPGGRSSSLLFVDVVDVVDGGSGVTVMTVMTMVLLMVDLSYAVGM